MSKINLHLSIVPGSFAICRLDPSAEIPLWVFDSHFFSISRSQDELSVVTVASSVPSKILAEFGWCCLKVEGLLDFSLTGILASLLGPLADVNISIFAISTFNTDYLLVKDENLERALQALQKAGHSVKH